jgi:demethylmenaquinone methyltransferase/2-methoxy-6-polyprenyl-1,4-benzoquinol methylase
MPRLARLFSSDSSSYAYLAESAAGWLGQQDLAAAIRSAGWEQVAWQDLTWGVVAVHTAVRAE